MRDKRKEAFSNSGRTQEEIDAFGTKMRYDEFLAICIDGTIPFKTDLTFDTSSYAEPAWTETPPDASSIDAEDMSSFIKYQLEPWF